MNTFEYYFHRETAVHTLLEEAAYSVSCSTSTQRKSQKCIMSSGVRLKLPDPEEEGFGVKP